ncbi:MAG: hypothetical protein HYR55_16630 [Acidobacteria bacterium]|nr:hypothetical protein [Acidobacteriota bacterium]MBI3657411.1 hypothetical protein [Acidobacteriota bacterium]
MRFCDRTFADYIAFTRGPFLLLSLVFGLRWLVSECGLRPQFAQLFSLTALSIPIVVYLPLKLYNHKFGAYPQLGLIYLLMACWLNLLITGAILLAAITGRENIYSLADLGRLTDHGTHILAHLTVGISVSTLINLGIGSIILSLLRRNDRRH